MRTVSVVEKNTVAQPPKLINIPNATATDVLPKVVGSDEISVRTIQNVGANTILYSLGCDCSNIAYHGYLIAGEKFTVPSGDRVSVFCVTNTSIVAPTVIRRNDNATEPSILFAGGNDQSFAAV